jgi:altronate dehydratase
MAHFAFDQVGRLPAPEDNVAIATKRLEAGTTIGVGGGTFTLVHTAMEGHRFALRPIAAGEMLLSWGLPFGKAIRAVVPGEYICNRKMLESLGVRNLDFALPKEPNFEDHMLRHELNERTFRPGRQVPPADRPRAFMGFRRGPGRGVGTRNFVVVMGTASPANGYARALAERFRDAPARFPHVDGVVAVTHTEGAGIGQPNNLDFVLRTLAGFMVNPNVAAVLAVDTGTEAIGNAVLRSFMGEAGYPLAQVPHAFLTLSADFSTELARGEAIVRAWLPQADACARAEEPAAFLNLGLQCGGSDAFSGVSGNPLAGWVARELVRNGGMANLAETDELIGAEPYILGNVRDLETARRFLEKIDVFRERAAWHGHSAEGNPSGGNNYRGLYNIALKSIGAARKKAPDVRLDYVIDYGERMTRPGYYFMDSPGNDLESVAGQVAAGANMIVFTTGNGSITNFPFVPTIKVVTTTPRFNMLAHEMDVNAGRYQDGTPMDALGQETFDLMLEIGSGRRCLGEKAGHSQVSIWRNWQQRDAGNIAAILNAPRPAGRALLVRRDDAPRATFRGIRTAQGFAGDQVGLIVPTSICSGMVARQIAERLNAERPGPGGAQAVSRYVALVHTEGCGAAGGYSEELYLRTLLGHLAHPLVRKGLLLEHGCEKTHNDAVRHYLQEHGLDPRRFGWASVQMDGGLERVGAKVRAWFAQALAAEPGAEQQDVGLEFLGLGLTAAGDVPQAAARALGRLAQDVVSAGGAVVVPENSTLLKSPDFRQTVLLAPEEVHATLAYGQPALERGFHVMECPTDHMVEALTGLGATGVQVMLAHVAGPTLQAHPMIPLIQASADARTIKRFGKDLDLRLEAGSPDDLARALLEQVTAVASRRSTPKLFGQGNTDFQLTRGYLGLSL